MENQSTCIKISLNLIQANQVPVQAPDCKGEGEGKFHFWKNSPTHLPKNPPLLL